MGMGALNALCPCPLLWSLSSTAVMLLKPLQELAIDQMRVLVVQAVADTCNRQNTHAPAASHTKKKSLRHLQLHHCTALAREGSQVQDALVCRPPAMPTVLLQSISLSQDSLMCVVSSCLVV